jgi:hypothetical protein
MATSDQVSQEYNLIKCFLYKYTPPFTKETGIVSSLSTFAPYSIPLDDTTYFTKYDISNFVTSYSFVQNIDETTYSWSVELQDLALSYGTINSKLKVVPPSGSTLTGGLSFSPETNSGFLLSEYETNANNIDNNNNTNAISVDNVTNPILFAKQHRGSAPGPLTSQNSNLVGVQSKQLNVKGLRLSDLIQEYDFISLFLYKNQTPLTDIWGTFTLNTNSGATNTVTGSVGTGAASTSAPTSLSALQNNPLWIFNYKITSDTTPAFQNYQNPADPFLQYESVLLTKMPNKKNNGQYQTLFSNEFNGFVMKKNISSSINQVDKVMVSGNGWSRLFGATRRVVKPSLFQNSLYQTGQLLGAQDISAMETVLAGQSIGQIIRDLFDLVYRIDFNEVYNTTSLGATTLASTNITSLSIDSLEQNPSIVAVPATPLEVVNSAKFFTSPINPLGLQSSTVISTKTSPVSVLKLTNSFYNITSLIVANSYPANLFNLPQYLLATVMKLRPFAYIEPITVPASETFVEGAIAAAAQTAAGQLTGAAFAVAQQEVQTNDFDVQVPPLTFQKAIQNYNTGQQVLNYGSTNPVLFEAGVQDLTAYFQFLANVFEDFNPQLQTPYEILDTIRSIAFVEIFEQPSGQFLIRSPQYNNMATLVDGRPDIALVRSRNLNIISSNYGETVENLVSKIFVNYSTNILPISVLQKFGYCDGKLLTQVGLVEMESAANPNAVAASLSNTTTNNSKTTGIFGYAEYLMDLSNAKLKTGTLICDLDNTVQVGQTFIDETKFKFGYIVGVSKQVSVTGTATMTLALSYVRDGIPTYATDGTIQSVNTDLLPVLTDIENSFSSGS